LPAVDSKTARIESKRPYKVGDRIEYGGTLWQVSQAPLEAPDDLYDDDFPDLMLWHADGSQAARA
jgi:hypothetical protein